jgi:hypothetical protein
MKQQLNEEFRRMQKLAGIITESQYKWESSKELGLDVNSLTYANFDQWKNNQNDSDEKTFFINLANKVKSGNTSEDKFNKAIKLNFNTLEWDSKPQLTNKTTSSPTQEKPTQSPIQKEESFKEKINKLEDKDLQDISMNVSFNEEDTDKQKVDTAFSKILKKINPDISLDDAKNKVISTNLALDNNKSFYKTLYAAAQRSYSVERGLKDYFIDNPEIFK